MKLCDIAVDGGQCGGGQLRFERQTCIQQRREIASGTHSDRLVVRAMADESRNQLVPVLHYSSDVRDDQSDEVTTRTVRLVVEAAIK